MVAASLFYPIFGLMKGDHRNALLSESRQNLYLDKNAPELQLLRVWFYLLAL